MPMKIKLPRGMKYSVETPSTGIVIPGSEQEPVITVFGRGARIQYRLVSCAMGQACIIDDTYSVDTLEEEEIECIDAWIESLIPSLLQEAGIRHFIRFLPDSNCYYDFASQTLYGANGYKEKKGSRDGNRENSFRLNGQPCKLTSSEIAFIELLTRTPNALFSREEVEDCSGIHGAKSLNQTWSRFKKYDSSIDATFLRSNGMFLYQGTPQLWVIGEAETSEPLTIEKLFRVVGYGDVVAALDPRTRQLNAHLACQAAPEAMLQFLGFDPPLLDLQEMQLNPARFVAENDCGTAPWHDLLRRYSLSLEAVWKRLQDNLRQNLSLSLNASTYYYETGEIPARFADLSEYSVTTGRLEKSLQRICPTVQELLVASCVGTDFFRYCEITVKPDTIVDYIVALLLACLSYCHGDSGGDRLSQAQTYYQNRLTALIRKRFHYSPPGDGKESIFEEIQRLLLELQIETKNAGLDSSVSKVSKINDLLNLLDYNDANSLLPPSRSRER